MEINMIIDKAHSLQDVAWMCVNTVQLPNICLSNQNLRQVSPEWENKYQKNTFHTGGPHFYSREWETEYANGNGLIMHIK